MRYSNVRPHSSSEISGLDLRQLRYAVLAADYGSIRQAAEALLMKQSTISRSIRQLEHTLGVTLFARTSGGVQATDAGRQFLRMARSVLDQLDMIVAVTQIVSH
jgi:DNA-binding transcriptional LysR family regulator